MKTKHIVTGAIVVAGIIAASAIATAQSNLKTEPAAEQASAAQAASLVMDDLNSFTDGKEARTPLKEEERVWLHGLIADGKIRLATEDDKNAWIKVAKSKGRRDSINVMDVGRTYAVLDRITIPKMMAPGIPLNGNILFIVPDGAPFPEVNGGVGVYDVRSGGWYQAGNWDDGEKRGVGPFPHAE